MWTQTPVVSAGSAPLEFYGFVGLDDERFDVRRMFLESGKEVVRRLIHDIEHAVVGGDEI